MIQSRAEQSRAEQSRGSNYNVVDLGKWVMAIFVVALHAHPFADISADWDYYTSGVLTRLAVPYFFVASGFFLFSKMPVGEISREKIKRYCMRLGKMLVAWTAVYLPIAAYDVWHSADHMHKLLVVARNTVFQGALMYHLWYLYASIVAVATIYFLFSKGLKLKWIIVLSLVLHIIVVLAYSYHGLYIQHFAEIGIVEVFVAFFAKFFIPANGWTAGLLYMSVGIFFAWQRRSYPISVICILLLLCAIAFGMESYFIREYSLINEADKGNIASYIMLILVSFLFLLSINLKLKDNVIYKHLREQSLFIYLVHPWFLFLGTGLAKKVLHMADYHMAVFLWTVACSIIASEFLRKICRYRRFSWLG